MSTSHSTDFPGYDQQHPLQLSDDLPEGSKTFPDYYTLVNSTSEDGEIWKLFKRISLEDEEDSDGQIDTDMQRAFCTYCGRILPCFPKRMQDHIKECAEMKRLCGGNSLYLRLSGVGSIVKHEEVPLAFSSEPWTDSATAVELEEGSVESSEDDSEESSEEDSGEDTEENPKPLIIPSREPSPRNSSETSTELSPSAQRSPQPLSLQSSSDSLEELFSPPQPQPPKSTVQASSVPSHPTTSQDNASLSSSKTHTEENPPHVFILSNGTEELVGAGEVRVKTPQHTQGATQPSQRNSLQSGAPNDAPQQSRDYPSQDDPFQYREQSETPQQDVPETPLDGLKVRIVRYLGEFQRPPTDDELKALKELVEYAWNHKNNQSLEGFFPTGDDMAYWFESYHRHLMDRLVTVAPKSLSIVDLSVSGWKVYGIILVQDGKKFLWDVVFEKNKKEDSEDDPSVFVRSVMDSLGGVSKGNVSAVVTPCERRLVRFRKLFVSQNPATYEVPCMVELLNRLCLSLLHSDLFKEPVKKAVEFFEKINAENPALLEKLGKKDIQDQVSKLKSACLPSTRLEVIRACTVAFVSLKCEIGRVEEAMSADSVLRADVIRSLQSVEKRALDEFCGISKLALDAVKAVQDPTITLSGCFRLCVVLVSEVMTFATAGNTAQLSSILTHIYDLVIERPLFLLAAFLDPSLNIKFSDRVMQVIRDEYKRFIKLHAKTVDGVGESMKHFETFIVDRSENQLSGASLYSNPEYKEVKALRDIIAGISPYSISDNLSLSLRKTVAHAARLDLDEKMMAKTVKCYCAFRLTALQADLSDESTRDIDFESSCIDDLEKLADKSSEDLGAIELSEEENEELSPLGYSSFVLRSSRSEDGISANLNSLFSSPPEWLRKPPARPAQPVAKRSVRFGGAIRATDVYRMA